jgi:hypothetical protein
MRRGEQKHPLFENLAVVVEYPLSCIRIHPQDVEDSDDATGIADPDG